MKTNRSNGECDKGVGKGRDKPTNSRVKHDLPVCTGLVSKNAAGVFEPIPFSSNGCYNAANAEAKIGTTNQQCFQSIPRVYLCARA